MQIFKIFEWYVLKWEQNFFCWGRYIATRCAGGLEGGLSCCELFCAVNPAPQDLMSVVCGTR